MHAEAGRAVPQTTSFLLKEEPKTEVHSKNIRNYL